MIRVYAFAAGILFTLFCAFLLLLRWQAHFDGLTLLTLIAMVVTAFLTPVGEERS